MAVFNVQLANEKVVPYNFPFSGGNASGVRLVRRVVAKGAEESWQCTVFSWQMKKVELKAKAVFKPRSLDTQLKQGVKIIREDNFYTVASARCEQTV